MSRRLLAPAVALATVVTLALFATDARPGDEEPHSVEVREDWLADDLRNAEKTLALLPPRNLPIEAFLEGLDASDVREDRDIGFGGRRLFVADHGGYTTTWIKAAAYEGRLVSLEVAVRGSRDSWPAIGKRLAKAWGKSFTAAPHGRRYRWSDTDGLAQHTDAIQKVLGAAPRGDVPARLADAVALLTSPLERLDVGETCYYGGTPPDGKHALDRIVAARHILSLRRVLRGPNPDGRVYAARALLRLVAEGVPLTPADERAIAAIRDSDVPISACSGCEVYETTAAKLLR